MEKDIIYKGRIITKHHNYYSTFLKYQKRNAHEYSLQKIKEIIDADLILVE